jgi:hypothetical protein
LLTRAHGDRVPGRHSTHEATATMSQMVRVVAPARATATFSSLARKPRWRATRVGSPPERTKRVARLSSRTLHRLTHRASVLPSRRSKHTGEDHAEAASRHGGGLRRAGAFPAFRAMRGVSTRLGNAEPRPSRSFLTRTPPAAVGRRQRLAPPRLRPASQRKRRRQGEPRDRGAPERHRQGTPRGHARHPEHRSIAVSKPNRREKTNRVFYFFERTRFSSGRPLLRDAHRCGVPARILNPLRSRR